MHFGGYVDHCHVEVGVGTLVFIDGVQNLIT